MSTPNPPDQRDPVADYQRGIQIYLQNLPQLLAAEQGARNTYDPARIQQQQALQSQYGPTQYGQQLDALRQLDPESYAVRAQLGSQIRQDLASGYQLPEQYDTELTNQFRGAQAARGNSLGTGNAGAEAAFKGKAALDLYQQHLQNAGNFLQSPTPEQQIGFIQGVMPDRSSAYSNPNAGYQGINIGQQSYQNMLAQYQLAGGGRNPWAGAASGAASGALAGSQYGGGYGALAGGIIGAAGGYFCDSRLKENIQEVGTSQSGIPIIRFNYRGYDGEIEAARAEDVQKVFPDAVTTHSSGYLVVNFNKTDVEFRRLS